MNARSIAVVIACCLAAGAALSCRLDVPITEMMKARTTIERARYAMAEQYDPENLKLAVSELFRCHDLLAKKDVKGAKKAAIQSAQYADAALAASLPKAVDNTLEQAETAYREADNLAAEEYASEAFTRAGRAIEETKRLKGENNLWEAYAKAREAAAASKQAKEAGMAQVPKVSEELKNMKQKAEALSAQRLAEDQKQSLGVVQGDLGKAESLIAENNLKEARRLMATAGETLRSIEQAVTKTTLKDKIAALRTEAEQLKKERGVDFAADDIEVVVSTLNEADSLIEQNRSDEAQKKISDAEASLTIAKEKTWKGVALDKAKACERLLAEAKEKDKQNRYREEIAKAENIIQEGKGLIEKNSFRESLEKFNEAESLLNSLSIARGKDFREGGLEDREGKRIYTVILDTKNRDCLWRIAHKVYRNARLWPLIYSANKELIKDPDLIFPGQQFVIPDLSAPKDKGPSGERGASTGGEAHEE